MSIERDFRFAAACGQQQRCVGEHEGSAVVPAINGSVIEADTAETAGAATALTMGLSAWVRLATPQKWAQLASNAGNPDIKTISPITGPCLKPWPEATGAGVQCILSP